MKGMLSIFIACALAVFLIGCAANMTTGERLQSAADTLQTAEDVIPELVKSGDLVQADADKLLKAINKTEGMVATAQKLAGEGLPQNAVDQFGLAIDTLRVAQSEVESAQAKQNIGRTIAALVIIQSMLKQQADIEKARAPKPPS